MLARAGALWAEQRDRFVLWLPAAMVAGAALYFTLPQEPPVWAPGLSLALGALISFLISLANAPARWAIFQAVFAGLFALIAAAGCGAVAGQVRTARVEAARLQDSIGPTVLIGWVERVERGSRQPRMVVRPISIEGVERLPRRVRVTAPHPIGPGRAVRCTAVLSPPSPPLTPGGYDMERQAYFDRIGAFGFAYGACRPVLHQPPGAWIMRLEFAVAAWRRELGEAIRRAAPGEGGDLAAALIIGDRSHLTSATEDAFFAAGLGHLLSVSGLHMSLVAGFAFSAIWAGLAFIPPLALRAPIKKIAAGAALLAAACYLVLCGAEVPAQRAFAMAAVALGAVLLDRPALTMRALGVAAVAVIALALESALEPGFQMSFAATVALVAAFEAWSRKDRTLPSPGPLVSGLRRFEAAVALALMTSLVAGLAADPIAAYHFQRVALYGLPANLAASPVVSFIVAPAALAAAVAAPFGLSEVPLRVVAWGLSLVAAIARLFADRPEAILAIARIPDGAFLCALAGALWATLWRGALRWCALGPAVAAIALAIAPTRPEMLFDSALKTIVVRTDEPGEGGWRALRAGRGGAFAIERLVSYAGLAPDRAANLAGPTGCVDALCAWRTKRGRAAAS